MRHDVDRANQNRLRALQGEERVFRAEDSEPDPSKQGQWFKNVMAADTLTLKIGAQVMLIKNLDQSLVNGTVGHVVGFGVPELGDDDDEDDAEAEWTLNSRDEPVRVKSELSVHEARKRQKIAEGVASGRIEQGPVVAWQTPNGIEKKVMVREEFKHEDNNGQKISWRKQVSRLDLFFREAALEACVDLAVRLAVPDHPVCLRWRRSSRVSRADLSYRLAAPGR